MAPLTPQLWALGPQTVRESIPVLVSPPPRGVCSCRRRMPIPELCDAARTSNSYRFQLSSLVNST